MIGMNFTVCLLVRVRQQHVGAHVMGVGMQRGAQEIERHEQNDKPAHEQSRLDDGLPSDGRGLTHGRFDLASSVKRWGSTDDFMRTAVCGIDRPLARYWVGVPLRL
mmetsp:Transcript_53134/g.124349  ORF Transcript_53134/g.124349 Transcript_53134/m.124349 type:complete len:106 (+) Transcript_53134:3119-3436(+)